MLQAKKQRDETLHNQQRQYYFNTVAVSKYSKSETTRYEIKSLRYANAIRMLEENKNSYFTTANVRQNKLKLLEGDRF